MGDYADDHFRHEIRSKYGFDPGDTKDLHVAKKQCPKCGKRVKETGLADHMLDVHHVKESK